LEINADMCGRALARFAPPHAVIIFLEPTNVCVAGLFDLGFGLTLNETFPPATGLSELFWSELLIALLFGPGWAGGF
jgi:hypothetical protein